MSDEGDSAGRGGGVVVVVKDLVMGIVGGESSVVIPIKMSLL